MFPKGIAFKIELEFYEAEKAKYAIVVRDAQQGEFSLEPSTATFFVGMLTTRMDSLLHRRRMSH